LHGGAEVWVRSEAFQKVAAPDVRMAAALRYAPSCSARHDLLPRAGEQGGPRVLGYLTIARARSGCGRGARKDCFPCLRKDDARCALATGAVAVGATAGGVTTGAGGASSGAVHTLPPKIRRSAAPGRRNTTSPSVTAIRMVLPLLTDTLKIVPTSSIEPSGT